jgi:uncharacterized protein (DUF433 family)
MDPLFSAKKGGRRVVCSPEILGGEPVFRGTRIPVQHIVSLLGKGTSEQKIVEDLHAQNSRRA